MLHRPLDLGQGADVEVVITIRGVRERLETAVSLLGFASVDAAVEAVDALVDLCCKWGGAHGLESSTSPGQVVHKSEASSLEAVLKVETAHKSEVSDDAPRGSLFPRVADHSPAVTPTSSARHRQSWCSMSTRSECLTAAESGRGTNSLIYHADSKELAGPSTLRGGTRKGHRKASAKIWGLIGRSTEEDDAESPDDGADVKRWSRLSTARDSILMHKESVARETASSQGMRSMTWLSSLGGLTAIGRSKDAKAKPQSSQSSRTQVGTPPPMLRGRTAKQSMQSRRGSLKTRSLTPPLGRSASWSSQYVVPGTVNHSISRSSGRSSAREGSKGGSCRGQRRRRPPTPPRTPPPPGSADRRSPPPRGAARPLLEQMGLEDAGASASTSAACASKGEDSGPVIEILEDPADRDSAIAWGHSRSSAEDAAENAEGGDEQPVGCTRSCPLQTEPLLTRHSPRSFTRASQPPARSPPSSPSGAQQPSPRGLLAPNMLAGNRLKTVPQLQELG